MQFKLTACSKNVYNEIQGCKKIIRYIPVSFLLIYLRY